MNSMQYCSEMVESLFRSTVIFVINWGFSLGNTGQHSTVFLCELKYHFIFMLFLQARLARSTLINFYCDIPASTPPFQAVDTFYELILWDTFILTWTGVICMSSMSLNISATTITIMTAYTCTWVKMCFKGKSNFHLVIWARGQSGRCGIHGDLLCRLE